MYIIKEIGDDTTGFTELIETYSKQVQFFKSRIIALSYVFYKI